MNKTSFNFIGENLSYWNWESEILSIEEISSSSNSFENKTENKIKEEINNRIKITIQTKLTNECQLFLLTGPKSHRPLLCIEGDNDYSGLWRVINIENNFIFCSFSHIKYTSKSIWNEKSYYLSKPSNITYTETNIQLISSTSSFNETNLNENQQNSTSINININTSTRGTKDTRRKIYLAPPLVFHTRVSIFNIDAIDTVNQTFRADIYAELRLKSIIYCEDVEVISRLLECYQANTYTIHFLHVFEIIGEKEVWTSFDYNHPGEALDYVIKIRLKAQFIERMELENFPFDIQDLNIPITFNSSVHRVALRPNFIYPSVFQMKNFQFSSIFDIIFDDLVFSSVHSSDPSESSAGIIYPRCTFTVYLERKTGYYTSNVILPMTIITLLSPLSCTVDEDGASMGTADRLSVTLTLLLTAVAYKFVVASSLPTVSYITLLDSHVLVCFVFICLNAVENVIYPLLVVYRGATKSDEWIFVLIFYLTFILFNLLYLIRVYFWSNKRNEWKSRMTMVERLRRQIAKKYVGFLTLSNMDNITNKILQEQGQSHLFLNEFEPKEFKIMNYFSCRKNRKVIATNNEINSQKIEFDFSDSIQKVMQEFNVNKI